MFCVARKRSSVMATNMLQEHMRVKHAYAHGGMAGDYGAAHCRRMNARSNPKPAKPRHFLKEWRQFNNLTQEAAADRIGITQPSLSKFENGKSRYDQDFLEAAAEAYNTTPASLLMRNPLDSEAVWGIQDQLSKADGSLRAKIMAVVETMLKTG